MLTKMKLKKGDTVIVNTGAEKGKKGTILENKVKNLESSKLKDQSMHQK